MHTLAKIETITNIRPIDGKDRIVLATVANYNTIISRDEFNEGDKCIYCYYDSILPLINPATKKPDFEFLRKRCYSDKYKGFRIRPMKMGGVVSEGLVLPLSVLPKSENLAVGTDVTNKLGITLYNPEELVEVKPRKHSKIRTALCRYKMFRDFFMFMDRLTGKVKVKSGYPDWIIKSDEENIEACYNKVSQNPDAEYVVTEKIEGCLREDSKIITPYGIKTVKEIYDEQYSGDVLSFNVENNEPEWKKCISTMKRKSYTEQWYKIETEEGETLYLTDIHPVYNPELKIYREAQNLKEGDAILVNN